MNQKKMSTFLKRKEKKKLLTAVLALECQAGMLLSYYKGGLITENNVFVFSSAVLVTQCNVRANLQLLNPCTHERHQVPATDCAVHRDSRRVLEHGQNVEERMKWSGGSPVRSARCVTGTQEQCMNVPHGASISIHQSHSSNPTDFGLIPTFYF